MLRKYRVVPSSVDGLVVVVVDGGVDVALAAQEVQGAVNVLSGDLERKIRQLTQCHINALGDTDRNLVTQIITLLCCGY